MKTQAKQITVLTEQIAKQFFELATFAAQAVWTEYAAKTAEVYETRFKEMAKQIKAINAQPSFTPKNRSLRKSRATSNGKGQSLADAVLNTITAVGRTGIPRDALMKMLPPGTRPNHWGAAIARHLAANRIALRSDRYYPTLGVAPVMPATPAKRRGRPPSKAQQPGAQPSL